MDNISRPLSDLLNLFNICQCCKQLGAIRYETVWCEKCDGHTDECDECNKNLDDAYHLINASVMTLIQKYGNDRPPIFWDILNGK